MHEQVIISHRGIRYEIGRGAGYYGIWPAGASHAAPVQWWPETAAGWHDAWARFTDIEPRRTIMEVCVPDQPGQPAYPEPHGQQTLPGMPGESPASPAVRAGRGPRALAAAALLAAGVAAGLAGLFPGYFGATSLTAHASEALPHVIYLAAWGAATALILLGGARARSGALLAAGTSVVTLGLFAADLGTAATGGPGLVGAGMIVSLIGWAACTAGAILAVTRAGAGAPGRPRGGEAILALVLAAVAAVGTAVAFAPSWDSYTLRAASGVTQSLTAGNAFANPALVIAGDVAVMVAVVAAVIAAAAWRPARAGAALMAGAIIPMAAQAISAVVQVGEGASPQQFGISPAAAAQAGLRISSGLTPVFWVYCAFVVALMLACALMLAAPAAPPPPPGLARPAGEGPALSDPAVPAAPAATQAGRPAGAAPTW